VRVGKPNGEKGLRDKSQPAEVICGKCKFRGTKPGNIPNHLIPIVAVAYRMEALFEGGAGSPYPGVFTPLEWESFLELKYARSRDAEKSAPQPKKPALESDVEAQKARLQERLNRR
jgi:hypothetical protein